MTSTPIPTQEPGAQEDDAAVWFARGIALEEDPATQTEALAAYQKVLEFQSEHAAAHINLGTLYYNRQDFSLAEGTTEPHCRPIHVMRSPISI